MIWDKMPYKLKTYYYESYVKTLKAWYGDERKPLTFEEYDADFK